MALSEPNSEQHGVIYADCARNDDLFGEKLQSIVSFAMSTMGIGEQEGLDQSAGLRSWIPSVFSSGDKKDIAELNFNRYCEALCNKLGPYEPYSRNVRLETNSKQQIANEMTELLPKKQPEFNIIISQAADHVSTVLDLPTTELGKLVYNTVTKELTLAQFVVCKIFRAGDNLEISPCLMKVKSKREQGMLLFKSFSWTHCSIDMQYEERKFVLNKFMIQQIIKSLQQKDYGF